MEESASTFGWSRWPFRIVADVDFARVWADRSELKNELDRRLRRLKTAAHSTVQMIWADFGAGKSHTLRRLEVLCANDPATNLLPIYTEIPVGTEGLLDLYRRLVGALPSGFLEQRLSRRVSGDRRNGPTSGARDLRQALKLLGSQDVAAQTIAREWLEGSTGVPHLKSLRNYGISARIEDPIRVAEIITELIRLIQQAPGGQSLLWLIDEFQRIADLPDRKRDAFAKSLVSLFNACPTGLHFVLSFSVAQQSTALALIPPDLRSRAATFPMLALPNLTRDDCLLFCEDLFDVFRIAPRSDRGYPFSASALGYIIDDLNERKSGVVTPRLLMERLEGVLFEFLDDTSGKPTLPIEVAAAKTMITRLDGGQAVAAS